MNFQYILSNVPSVGAVMEEFSGLEGCLCIKECSSESGCSCLVKGVVNYDTVDGTFIHKTDSRHPHFECSDECACALNPDACGNRCVQFGVQTKLKVVSAGEKGLGVIAEMDIKAGTFVAEYIGEVVSREEAIRRAIQRTPKQHNYIFTVNEMIQGEVRSTYIDAASKGNIARFINHSCEPNLFPQVFRIGRVSPSLALFALRDIKNGEELSYSYGSPPDGVIAEESIAIKRCLCNAPNCRSLLPNTAF